MGSLSIPLILIILWYCCLIRLDRGLNSALSGPRGAWSEMGDSRSQQMVMCWNCMCVVATIMVCRRSGPLAAWLALLCLFALDSTRRGERVPSSSNLFLSRTGGEVMQEEFLLCFFRFSSLVTVPSPMKVEAALGFLGLAPRAGHDSSGPTASGEKTGSKGGSLGGSLSSGIGSMDTIKTSDSLISKRVLTLSSSSTFL